MHPQHLASAAAPARRTAALASHLAALESTPYATPMNCDNVAAGNTDVFLTLTSGSDWHEAVPGPLNSDRRLRCPRASQCWPHSALSQPFRHAHPSSKKNMSWSHPSPSRLSPCTQASTSNACRGQAFAPVSNPSAPCNAGVAPRIALAVWGVSC